MIVRSYTGVTEENSYWRSFNLDDFGVTGNIEVTRLEVGVEQSTPGGGLTAQPATLRFYAESPEELEAARRGYADRRRFASLLDALSADLEQVYARAEGPDQARGERELVFERYRLEVYPSRDWETGHFDGFLEAPLSNAYLVAQATYLAELACFDAWLRALDGDLERFIALHHEQPGAWRDDLAECGTR